MTEKRDKRRHSTEAQHRVKIAAATSPYLTSNNKLNELAVANLCSQSDSFGNKGFFGVDLVGVDVEMLASNTGIGEQLAAVNCLPLDGSHGGSLAEIHLAKNDTHCPYCTYTCNRKDNLRVHIRRHTGEKPYTCMQCPRSFVSKSELNTHVKYHQGILKYSCSFCSFTGSTEESLVSHSCSREYC